MNRLCLDQEESHFNPEACSYMKECVYGAGMYDGSIGAGPAGEE
jgi:hypothetical protein